MPARATAGSSDDDAFYDRTRREGAVAAITKAGGKKAKKEEVAIDAATLSAQREVLHAEKAELLKRIEEEKLLALEVRSRRLSQYRATDS